jgi:uncharacterized DUF497 family protein
MADQEPVLRFDWDPAKNRSNRQKHGFGFPQAAEVFNDSQVLVEDATRPEHGERRSKAIGRVGAVILCVIFTDRGEFRRIISARRARRDERERYRQSAEAS